MNIYLGSNKKYHTKDNYSFFVIPTIDYSKVQGETVLYILWGHWYIEIDFT